MEKMYTASNAKSDDIVLKAVPRWKQHGELSTSFPFVAIFAEHASISII